MFSPESLILQHSLLGTRSLGTWEVTCSWKRSASKVRKRRSKSTCSVQKSDNLQVCLLKRADLRVILEAIRCSLVPLSNAVSASKHCYSLTEWCLVQLSWNTPSHTWLQTALQVLPCPTSWLDFLQLRSLALHNTSLEVVVQETLASHLSLCRTRQLLPTPLFLSSLSTHQDTMAMCHILQRTSEPPLHSKYIAGLAALHAAQEACMHGMNAWCIHAWPLGCWHLAGIKCCRHSDWFTLLG